MFLEFYEEWMEQLEDHLTLLLKAQTENFDTAICLVTINKLMEHPKKFYKVKWAHEDVSGLSSPIWLNPFWVTGWKPSMAFRLIESLKKGSESSLASMTEEQTGQMKTMAFRLIESFKKGSESSLASMTEEQTGQIKTLQAYVMVEEEKVEMEMERQLTQMNVAGLVDGIEGAMKMADCVRLKTLKGVLEVLNPMQGVEFLAFEFLASHMYV